MADWYLVIQGEKAGPMSPQSVKQKLEMGEIRPETLVWREGMSQWAPLQETELFARGVHAQSDAENARTATSAVTLESDQYGGFWIRFGAICIDNIIIAIPTQAFKYLLLLPGGATVTAGVILWIISLAISAAYFGVLQARMQGTIGKRALKLRLVNAADRGPITLEQGMKRWAMSIVSGLCFAIGYLAVVSDPKKQSWHDRVAGTLVIRE